MALPLKKIEPYGGGIHGSTKVNIVIGINTMQGIGIVVCFILCLLYCLSRYYLKIKLGAF
jgi:hypothetical protein